MAFRYTNPSQTENYEEKKERSAHGPFYCREHASGQGFLDDEKRHGFYGDLARDRGLASSWQGSYESKENGAPHLLSSRFLDGVRAMPPPIFAVMKSSVFLLIFCLIAVSSACGVERSVLARVTVYWRSGGSGDRACWNGSHLRAGHCAVDPKRIAYGSTVVFPDRSCVAVDTGPAVVRRTAARQCAKTSVERNALVVDRFFETRKEALAWARAHPHFMTLRICDAESAKRQAEKSGQRQTEKVEQVPPPMIAARPQVAPWQKWGCVILEEAFVRAF